MWRSKPWLAWYRSSGALRPRGRRRTPRSCGPRRRPTAGHVRGFRALRPSLCWRSLPSSTAPSPLHGWSPWRLATWSLGESSCPIAWVLWSQWCAPTPPCWLCACRTSARMSARGCCHRRRSRGPWCWRWQPARSCTLQALLVPTTSSLNLMLQTSWHSGGAQSLATPQVPPGAAAGGAAATGAAPALVRAGRPTRAGPAPPALARRTRCPRRPRSPRRRR
mmetsp:Transcript_97628/g.259348  ORF Transcript_97628/g.259348 Transcript_97628/m.259348 type:complete len:221 (-) Transcript_97628:476-1138(-)